MEAKQARNTMSQPRIKLVCFAVKEEGMLFRPAMAYRDAIRIVLTGMGRRNAERAIRQALSLERPNLVLSAGFAGGLNPELKTGEVIFSAEGEPELAAALVGAGARIGRFHCAEGVVTTAEDKRRLWQATGADAVEMESRPICDICREQGVSSATVRVILDRANQDLPLDFNQLMTQDQRLATGKLALAVLKSPAKISALLRLRSQSQFAAKRLAQVLVRFLGDEGKQQ